MLQGYLFQPRGGREDSGHGVQAGASSADGQDGGLDSRPLYEVSV